jgi:hypothetical protein
MPIILKKEAKVVPRGSEVYLWERVGSGFHLSLLDTDFAELKPEGPEWNLTVQLGKERFSGIRPSLEIAFKTVDSLIWKEKKELWSKIRPFTVLREFEGNLYDLN